MKIRVDALALAALFLASPLLARAADDSAAADRLFQAKQWEPAAKAYEALATGAPKNPVYAFRRGACLVGLGRGAEAIAFFDKAAALGLPAPLMQAWSARALAQQGQRDPALELLKLATAGGFSQVAMLDAEADFASLRADPRFKAARETADRNARPCAYAPEYRQLDFWVGDWSVTSSGAVAGESHVERILNDCVIYENWTGAGGVAGKSFNLWDVTTKEWRQSWVDSAGTLTEFHGEARDGAMYYRASGAQPGPDGRLVKALQKMTFFDQGGAVRQLGETSLDEGRTWTIAYDLLYTRKPAP